MIDITNVTLTNNQRAFLGGFVRFMNLMNDSLGFSFDYDSIQEDSVIIFTIIDKQNNNEYLKDVLNDVNKVRSLLYDISMNVVIVNNILIITLKEV